MIVLKTRIWTVVVLAAAGCAAASPPAGNDASAAGTEQTTDALNACTNKQQAAQELVGAAILANRSCKEASDCVVVGFHADCFDACSRVISVGGKAAYEQAVSEANAKYCDAYGRDNCPRWTPPPCPMHEAAKCENGTCE